MNRPRIALVCDYREEGWPSMDLVADMLARHLEAGYQAEFAVQQVRAPFRNTLGRLPHPVQFAGAFRNADRLWNRFRIYPAWLRRRVPDFDLFHIMDHSYAQLNFEIPARRLITWCHDLDTFRCLLEPEREPRPFWFRAMAGRILNGLRRSAHVTAGSEWTRQQLLAYKLVPPERVTLVYNGTHPAYSPGPTPDDVAATLNGLLGSPSAHSLDILHVGSTIPRKRIDILLRVFAAICKRFPDARLLRVGGRFTPPQQALADSLGVAGAICHLPFLSYEQLAGVYRRSTLLLQTSDTEGFGLPLPEAMACGCPVLSSDIPALREAGGEAACFTPPGEAASFGAAAIDLLSRFAADDGTRQQMRSAGFAHSARFSWENNAASNAALYRKLLAA